ncbi:hypothetical protein D9758_003679 [Tetrapyrgos nigripes]|uniref:WLM domain-containing protein n=1 Tax=Tetrapyrgos nigripes TaxID=182062 RepID=A0A8H5GMK7_9AGAR|nr:hypothetical protein D9758_003679 [Tetrapyrgos nigripes]
MVHLRFNENETNPNPHINFITALPMPDQADEEDARQLLRALAAQVRPVMKAYGFSVNSFEEYEHNTVFAGRNWNNGETVELVLRRPGGSFLPTSWLMSTLCHELAHIKHMNHGPAFQVLWKRLRVEVRQLQDRGYYGDGYWSAGTRLADSAEVRGDGIDIGDLPEYMCGGAHTRTRPARIRQRRSRGPRETVPSNKTGRQTAKQRKAGSRVTSKYAFMGEGATLNGEDPKEKGKGTGFGKQAGSKRAREERALAAERRLQMLQSQSQGAPSTSAAASESEHDSNDEEAEDIIPETDSERRQALQDSETSDLNGLKTGNHWHEYDDDFIFTGQGSSEPIEIPSDEDVSRGCDAAAGSTFVTGSSSDRKGKRKQRDDEDDRDDPTKLAKSMSTSKETSYTKKGKNLLGNIAQDEVQYRKKEALGLTPSKGRTLREGKKQTSTDSAPASPGWACLICTLCAIISSLSGLSIVTHIFD